MTRAALFGAAVASLQAAVPTTARSDALEALIMPGPVSAAHKKLESKCANCHRPFDQNAQRRLCIDCHDHIRADVESRNGFHGKRARVSAAVTGAVSPYDVECTQCHSEHLGRDADIIGLDADLFDHAWTDYPLEGLHLGVRCEDCHRARVRYRSTPQRCFGCHADDDPHHAGLGEDCATCHNVKTWQDATYDHTKTGFSLAGSHGALQCSQCHPGARYKNTPTSCIDCHRIDDAHESRRGERCADCHDETRWKRGPFDHGSTRFPLRGGHRGLDCGACHPTTVFGKLSMDCVACHRDDDAHTGSLGTACQSCHQQSRWLDAIRFDHDLTAFPLIGLHQLQPCEACHGNRVYTQTASSCRDCHSDDDVHEAALGPACDSCHTPNGWSRWLFDHDRQTRYPLVEAHERAHCAGCHVPGTDLASLPPTTCRDCHRSDDTHDGAFGRACERCHGLDSFEQPTTLR